MTKARQDPTLAGSRRLLPLLRLATSAQSCRAPIVPVDLFDVRVVTWYTRDDRPHMLRTFYPGRHVADEIAALNRQISEAVAALD